ncbi:MAG: hypothetical protein IKH64_10095 [Prevotella sp.]|nr:hypothetical protein [Prevotella sp.]
MVNSTLFRKIELQLLMNLTARAMNKPARRIWTLSNDQALKVYAEYTRRNLTGPIDESLLRRMNEEAWRMGVWLRRWFFLQSPARIQRFIIALYRNIGIELEGQIPGNLCFKHCFFSRYYTTAVCLAASALDEGIIRGIAGEGQLLFQQRITEGCECCKATFTTTNPQKK